jgi:hypothetical protein
MLSLGAGKDVKSLAGCPLLYFKIPISNLRTLCLKFEHTHTHTHTKVVHHDSRSIKIIPNIALKRSFSTRVLFSLIIVPSKFFYDVASE